MTVFTSERERRLWLWALIVMMAIYASLGPARTLVDALRERNLLNVAFFGLVLVVVVAVGVQWIKKRPGWSEIGVGLGVALAYWMTFLRIENPAERTHLIEYGVVAALIHMALLERIGNGQPVRWPAGLTVGVIALLGMIDEGIQFFLPSRVFDWNDVFFNAFAGFMVVVARLAIAPVNRPGWRLWFMWLVAGAVGWGWSMDAGTFGPPRPFELLPSIQINLPLYLNVALGSIFVGAVHWLLLRKYLPSAGRWVLAGIGAALSGALVVSAVGLLDAETGWALGVVVYGFLAGVLQWLVLRKQVHRAGWWVLASGAGWFAAIPAGDYAGPPGWAVYAAVTGAVLVWLLRQEN